MILKYPKHFYDPIRIEIAVSQMQHDFRKLFPSINPSEWKNIDSDIAQWFSGSKFELEAVHDFWNFFDGITRGLKLKSLLSWVTAENVIWSREEVDIKEIVVTWDFPGLEFMGKSPYRAVDVSRKLIKMPKEQERLKKDSEFRSKRYMPRDHFPIILFHDQNGGVIGELKGFYVLEGNRRTVKAITNSQKKIVSYVARFKNEEDKWPENYWIDTGLLRDLIFLGIYYEKEKDDLAFKTIRNFYQLLLRDFDIARVATFDKSFKNFETSARLLNDLFYKDLR